MVEACEDVKKFSNQNMEVLAMVRALVVQISDVHFLSSDKNISNRGGLIAAALQPLLPLSAKVIVLLTGDISQSGKKEEFEIAERFLSVLTTEIATRHGLKPSVITVPGNHDADFDSPRTKVRTRVLKQLATELPEDIEKEDVDECVQVFSAYNDFAQAVETEKFECHSAIWRSTSISVDEHTLLVHCVNNAWSCEKKTEPGSLGFPTKLHSGCDNGDGVLRILAMHHPSHWIAARQYREFRKLARECAEVCFTGHEHQTNAGTNVDRETGSTLYVEGAALQEHGDPTKSGFNAALINFEDSEIEVSSYGWNGSLYASIADPYVMALPKRSDVIGLTQQWRSFINDPGSNVAHHAKERLDLRDLYVYPELERQADDEDTPVVFSASQLAAELTKSTKPLLIKGGQGSGKTALLKCLFSEAINAGLYPVYVNGINLKNSSQEDIRRLLARSIREQYAEAHALRVEQATPAEKILLLDNLDRYEFPDKYLTAALDALTQPFGKVISTADPEFDLKEAFLSDELAPLRDFEQFSMLEFGFKLRFQLVTRWFNLAGHATRTVQEIEHADKQISRIVGRGLVPSFPLYLLIILQGIEVGRAGELENSALGHYYEYMILSALGPKVRQENVHEILNYCSHFAWFLHSVQKTAITEREFRGFHSKFEQHFDLEIDFQKRLRLLNESNLFMEIGEHFGFRYPYSYFFFLGRYLSKSLSDPDTLAFVKRCCDNLHVREYGNAMLFLAHHSSDKVVYDALRMAVNMRFANVAPVQFQSDTEQLDKLVDSAPVLVFDEAKRRAERVKSQEEDQRIEYHLEEVANQPVDSLSSEDQKKVTDLIAELNGLVKGIEILGTVLKANFGSINAEAKQELIEALFKGGLRGLRVFVDAFTDVPDYIFAELAAVVEDNQEASIDDRNRAIKVRVFHIIGRFSFWFIRRIGASVGSKNMTPAITRYVLENDNIANRLVGMASSLETPNRIPFNDLRDLNERVSKTAFAQSVLRWIVFTRIHMYQTTEAEKQQVCQELGIQLTAQHAVEYRTRNTKRLK